MLGGYLSGYWMLGLMPTSYYKFTGGIDWVAVAIQLLLQDVVQYLMHFGEHKISFALYRLSHKPHHRFTNPKLFDAFNGSVSPALRHAAHARRTLGATLHHGAPLDGRSAHHPGRPLTHHPAASPLPPPLPPGCGHLFDDPDSVAGHIKGTLKSF